MKSDIRSIHEAGLGRRMVAMIMDAAIFAFTFIALALWVFTPIANKAMNYKELGVQGLKYQVFSKLYVGEEVNEEDGSKKVIDLNKFEESTGNVEYTALCYYVTDNVEFYKDRLHYYYCCYKTGENVEVIEGKNPDDFKAPDYNIYIKDNSGNNVLPKDYFTDAWFTSLIDGKTTPEEYRNLAYNACKELYESSYYKQLNNDIKACQVVIFLPPFVISFLGFYFLVPLLYKNGETFGKKVMHIGFATKDGFEVKKRQIVFRQFLLFAWVSLSSFVVGIGFTSLATLGVGVVIYLVATAISKTKRSPIDYAAYTYLISTSNSVWFKDAEEEEKKEVELKEKMSKYRKYEPDQSHVIQVGTEIVNEDVKKEFEEEKLKKVKK